jgi:hypothetical protein
MNWKFGDMATYTEASSKRDVIFTIFATEFKLRPRAIGIMAIGDQDYAIKVTLPGRPMGKLPSELHGIPVRYDLAEEPAMLAGGSKMKWFQEASHQK